MKQPYEAIFTLAAKKSVDGTSQLVGMLFTHEGLEVVSLIKD